MWSPSNSAQIQNSPDAVPPATCVLFLQLLGLVQAVGSDLTYWAFSLPSPQPQNSIPYEHHAK